MKFIFLGDFTMNTSVFVINENSDVNNKEPLIKFNNDEDTIKVISEIGNYIPDEILFMGHNAKFREFENYYKEKNKEVIIKWQ